MERTGASFHAGDVVRCEHCGYTYTFRRSEGTAEASACRRCGRRDLGPWTA